MRALKKKLGKTKKKLHKREATRRRRSVTKKRKLGGRRKGTQTKEIIIVPPKITRDAIRLKQQKRQKRKEKGFVGKTTDLKKIRLEMKKKRKSIKGEKRQQVRRNTSVKCEYFRHFFFISFLFFYGTIK